MIRFTDKENDFEFEIEPERIENLVPGPSGPDPLRDNKVTIYFQPPAEVKDRIALFKRNKYFSLWLWRMERRTLYVSIGDSAKFKLANVVPHHIVEYSTNPGGSEIQSIITTFSMIVPSYEIVDSK